MLKYDDNIGGTPPSNRGEFEQSTCFYSIYDGNNMIKDYEKAIIQFEDMESGSGYVPYIIVDLPSVNNPLYKCKLRYNNGEWPGSSKSIKRGEVKFG